MSVETSTHEYGFNGKVYLEYLLNGTYLLRITGWAGLGT